MTPTFAGGRALIVGVSTPLALPPTVTAAARELHAVLTNPKHTVYPDAILLIDPTIADVVGRLRQLSAADPHDTALLLFSTRMTADGLHAADGLIPAAELAALINATPARRVVTIFDVAHAAGDGVSEPFLESIAIAPGRVALASCRSDEASLTMAGMRTSVFAHYLIDGLKGGARTRGDGMIRVFDLFEYVAEQVPARTRQHPMLEAADLRNNFPLALYQGGRQVQPSLAPGLRSTAVDRAALRSALSDHFAPADIEDLLAQLQTDLLDEGLDLPLAYDRLDGDAKDVKILSLIDALDRRGHLATLVSSVRRNRSGII
jgi:hypothetical protein